MIHRGRVRDVDFVSSGDHITGIKLNALVPQKTLDGNIQSLDHHNLLVMIERVKQSVQLLELLLIFERIIAFV